MPIIDVPTDEYIEPEVVQDSDVHQLRVISTETREVETKQGTKTVVDVVLRVMDSALINPKVFRHTLWIPGPSDPPALKNDSLGAIIRFKEAIGDDTDKGVNPDLWVGKDIYARLRVKNDEVRGPQNAIRLIVKQP
jgi:hypothetical protein